MEVTIDGVKYRAVTREEMREMDRTAIEDFGIPGLLLMENAGRGAAVRALAAYRERRYGGARGLSPLRSEVREADKLVDGDCPRRGGAVLILCGRGNNGGDGFVIARHLHNAGLSVAVRYLGRVAEIAQQSDAGVNYSIARKMKIDFREISGAEDIAEEVAECNGILIDALLGTGLTGAVRAPFAAVIALINRVRPYTIAVDTPSGLDCNSGMPLGCAVLADETATFGLPKVGFFRGEGPRHAGRLTVVEISLPREIVEE